MSVIGDPTKLSASKQSAITPARRRPDFGACGIGLVAAESGQASREIIDLALAGLGCLRHRAALAADGRSADGAGILVPLPRNFFARVVTEMTGASPEPDQLGVAFGFFDRHNSDARSIARAAFAAACKAEEVDLLGWRTVPTDDAQLGEAALAEAPAFEQAIFSASGDDAEARAFRIRRRTEAACREADVRAYFASCSFSLVTYKALVVSDRLTDFYPDLAAPDFVAHHAVFHSRFSTNTAPAWERAQPFRHICHNGEINTIEGNERRMLARGILGTEAAGLGPEEIFRPVLDGYDSDSGKLDSAIELLMRGGRDIRHTISMLVPEAWETRRDLDPDVRDYFTYHAALAEPWDGPAGLIFTDGKRVGAALDRNGLRPLRWQRTADGIVVCCSEAGAVPLANHGSIKRGRLGPGEMLCVDPDSPGSIWQDDTFIKATLAAAAPYGEWVRDGLVAISSGRAITTPPTAEEILVNQVAFGCNKEEIAVVLIPMTNDAKEPTFSMGDDTPFAAVATQPRLIFGFLKQRFAQVSNPPIDHLRERLVMSLRTFLGPRAPLLSSGPEAARLLELRTFFLFPDRVLALLDDQESIFPTVMLDATFSVADGPAGLATAIADLTIFAVSAVRSGVGIVVISDAAISPTRAPVPSLLALGAIHHGLVSAGTRDRTSLVVDSGDARDTHSVAALISYGADAVCPRVALLTVASIADEGRLGETHASDAQAKFQAAIEDGVLKILAKMGICTIDGYRGAQIFEALGLGRELVDTCLQGTTTTVGGIGFAEIAADVLDRHTAAFGANPALTEPGIIRFRKRGGEYHENNPELIAALHAAVGLNAADADDETDDNSGGGEIISTALIGRLSSKSIRKKIGDKLSRTPIAPPEDQGRVIFFEGIGKSALPDPDPVDKQAAHLLTEAIESGKSEFYERFRELVQSRPTSELHDLLDFVPHGEPIALSEVEPVEAITRRFSSGAMSHGSLSAEAHETLAIAMNMVGGKSNCGEGGENPARFRTRGTARDRNSKIKQIASGRFGVTPEYCAYADELNIKMAQGSKPGEGGQLPGHKVSGEIARLRFTQPGVGLISPPPHHDIYSIEDLAQLIYDLKQVNPLADVSVKLVAEDNVGVIAAGVVKALAEVVQISGANGGTGASPLSSIKNAGLPWELGLADAQRTLIENDLRSRVRLRVDGGFKTGRDVMIAALFGADEFSFGTVVMLAEGCIMVRACHRDTCPTGIATQRPGLRAKFAGTPEGVATYMVYVAEEVRGLLAQLGFRSLDEAIGKVEYLQQRRTGNHRADSLDLSPLLQPPSDPTAVRSFSAHVPLQRPRSELDARLLEDAYPTLWSGGTAELEYTIANSDRSIGASLGGAIGLEFGLGVPRGSVVARFNGSAGQSFGAFLANGVTLELIGEAQDYVGKGMSGGRVIVRASADDAGDPVLVGNTILYGATGGQIFVAGRAGERFCVRNSGASAVVEGVGDHACEYMTGGTVVVLGDFGYNLGAGMTGGQAFVYDPKNLLAARLNRQLVDARLIDDAQATELEFLVEEHRSLTGSTLADTLLGDWAHTLRFFWRVAPVAEVARIERANEGVLDAAR